MSGDQSDWVVVINNKMMRNLVFDIESKRTVDEVRGWFNKHKMGIAVLCAVDFDTGEEMIFSDSYRGAMGLNEIYDIFKENRLIGFNIKGFDIRLMQEEFHINGQDVETRFAVLDISDGRRVSLGSVSKATLGESKLMDGADAPLEWRKGKREKDAVVKYCMDDVLKTKKILEYGIDNGHVFYNDGFGVKKTWNVDWKEKMASKDISVLYPKCFPGYRVKKKAWQCARCAFKVPCSRVE